MTDATDRNNEDQLGPARPGIAGRIRNYFLTGLIVAGPVAVTLWLIWWFVTWVDGLVRPLIPEAYRPETHLPLNIPGFGLVIAFVALTLLGFLTANFIGSKFVNLGESILNRMPIVRPIYRTSKQIFQTLFSSSGSSFRRVGLVEFPGKGMWSLVFLTQTPSDDIAARLPSTDDYVAAFMPCTPNPTTGFFFYVPRSDVIELDISVEQAMQLIMSAGMVQPGGNQQNRLAMLAHAARAQQMAHSSAPASPIVSSRAK